MKPRSERDHPGHRTTHRRHRASHPEQALKPPTVEADHDLLPDDDHGHRHPAGLRDQLLRSEEHTSELQSLAYLVCRLLLEKKKKETCHVYTFNSNTIM